MPTEDEPDVQSTMDVSNSKQGEDLHPTLGYFNLLVDGAYSAGKFLVYLVLFAFFVLHWSIFSDWIKHITHFEGLGFKIDIDQVQKNVERLFSVPSESNLSAGSSETRLCKVKGVSDTDNQGILDMEKAAAIAAVRHAELLGSAIQGAKILWVDPHPDNNCYERLILEGLGISVQLALTTEEALEFLSVSDVNFDLVISNMSRKKDENIDKFVDLKNCPGYYYDLPFESKLNDLSLYNKEIIADPPAGFAMAELIASYYDKEKFGDRQRPRIIFYTAGSGGKSANACARIVTNRPDVLLENIVSALSEFRSGRLPDPTVPKPGGLTVESESTRRTSN
jgi:CheY-like chemotaxis protein